ncbi:hypothetical protein SUGI_0731520 [Cryptomeria japonica]|nr:hypothetical protein SUGI_0731520 [Cryptomeria japonica]
MDNYMYRRSPQPEEQRKELANCRKRKPSVEDVRQRSIMSTKVRLHEKTEHVINNNSSNSSSSQGHGYGTTNRSPPAGLNSLVTTSNSDKTPLPSLVLSPPKAFNWRLACFLASEYLSRGTLLGKPWPTQKSDTMPWENATAHPKKKLRGDEAAREQEALYSSLTTNFLRSDDIHIPHIFNPSQLAAWLGFK